MSIETDIDFKKKILRIRCLMHENFKIGTSMFEIFKECIQLENKIPNDDLSDANSIKSVLDLMIVHGCLDRNNTDILREALNVCNSISIFYEVFGNNESSQNTLLSEPPPYDGVYTTNSQLAVLKSQTGFHEANRLLETDCQIDFGQSINKIRSSEYPSFEPTFSRHITGQSYSTIDENLSSNNYDDILNEKPRLSSIAKTRNKEIFIPEKFVELRKFQMELAGDGLSGKNTIICAPTGCGKTYTAAYICKKRQEALRNESNNSKNIKIIFVVPIRTLKQQQQKAFQQYFLHVSMIEGDSIVRTTLDTNADVIMVTAQSLVNSLNETPSSGRQVKIEEIDILVMDECHHTKKNHPYARIIHACLENRLNGVKVPQIIGLSASLGAGFKGEHRVDIDLPITFNHYINMCALYDTDKINYVVKNRDDLDAHNPKPMEIMEAINGRKLDVFADILKNISDYIIESINFDNSNTLPLIGSDTYEQCIVNLRKDAESNGHYKLRDATFFLQGIHKAFEYHLHLQLSDSFDYLCNDVFNVHPSFEDEILTSSQVTGEFRNKWRNYFSNNREILSDICLAERLSDNPMLEHLVFRLNDIYEKNKNSQGIVMVKTVFATSALEAFIRKNVPNSRPTRVVGQGQKAGTMTEEQQKEAIKKFRRNVVNILVSTDILQEGHDLPTCNFVIRYNFVSNEIGYVQAQGRARSKDSFCYLIVQKGSSDENHEKKNQQLQIQMVKALDEIRKLPNLNGKIAKAKEDLSNKEIARKMQTIQETMDYNLRNYSFHCASCTTQLFTADMIRKNGTQYITIDEDFINNRISVVPKEKIEYFNRDNHIAIFFCKSRECIMRREPKDRLGTVLLYKCPYPREKGYSLDKSALTVKNKDDLKPKSFKKWTKLPFPESIIQIDE